MEKLFIQRVLYKDFDTMLCTGKQYVEEGWK